LRFFGLDFCLVLTVFCCGDALGNDGPSQVVVWVRAANDLEMRLSPETVPALRDLARNGVSLPRLTRLTAGEIVAALSPLRAALGKEGYRQVGSDREEDGADGASSRLAAKFGEPPPVSEEEKEILRRLREAAGDKAPETTPGTPEAPGTPDASGPAAGEQRAQAVLEGLREGARLVVAVDGDPAGEGAATEAHDRELAAVVRKAGLEGKAGPRRAILLVLIPTTGRPALVAAGAGLKKGRVSRLEPGAEELAAAVARFLGLAEAAPGSASWFAEACLQGPLAGGRS
jgi:hypothetical protein